MLTRFSSIKTEFACAKESDVHVFDVYFLACSAQHQYHLFFVSSRNFSESDVRTVTPPRISAGARMFQSVWSRLSRNAGVAIAALFAGFLLSPRIAQAGCGDYVMIGNGHVPMAHSLPDQPSDGSSPGRADHSPPHRPCQEPGCSNGSVPPLAPIPVTTDSIDRWTLIPNDTLPNPVSCSNVLAEPLQIVVDGFRLSILRPPR